MIDFPQFLTRKGELSIRMNVAAAYRPNVFHPDTRSDTSNLKKS
jgi:hypothetical protein